MTELREQVRRRYAEAAVAARAEDTTGCGDRGAACCPEPDRFGGGLYGADASDVDATVLAASLGCGNPTAVAELHAGETVLDLGSGAGLDVLLSARRVGPTGTAYGLDMTDEMLDLARENAAAAGVDNAVFVKGYIEDVPLPDASIDVVISNCVVNLSDDKSAVFGELARVVRPGGRIAISDVVADDRLTTAQRADRGSHVGCIAGALSFTEYRDLLSLAGFEQVEITATHEVADGMVAAVVRATRPR